MRFEIKWDKRISSYYIHGSKLSFFKEDDEVHFENPHISPGATIVEWRSEVDYQSGRTGLQLPLLKRGHSYELRPNILAFPEASVAVKFKSFDQAENQLDTQVLSLEGGEIFYDKAAYSYTIELISTGVEALCFKEILLEAKGGEA